MSENNYQPNISFLRIVSTLSVVWLHTCSTLVQNPDLFPMSDLQARFYNSSYQMMCWTVPVFYMITGALLLDPTRKITVNKILTKYVLRVVLALIIFGIPFAILKLIMETGEKGMNIIFLSLKAIMENGSLRHMWFLYSMIGVYLVLPVLKAFTGNSSRGEMILTITFLFLFNFIIPYINSVLGLKIAFDIPLKYPVFYLLTGYYLYSNEHTTKKVKMVSLVFISVLVLLIWLLNYNSINTKNIVSYDSPITAILAVSIFIIFKNTDLTKKIYKQYHINIWLIDRLCFGVFLIHPFFIQFTYRFLKMTPLGTDAYPIMTVGFYFVFITLSFLGSWVLSLIKPLKDYVL